MFKYRELEARDDLSRLERKAIKSRTNRFWLIGLDLLSNSKAFRMALLNKTCSKKGW